MNILIGAIIVALLIVAGVSLAGTLVAVLWWLLIGLVIGAFARIIVPGTGGLGLLATSLCGVAGALIGGLVADRVLEVGDLAQLGLSVAGAALLVALYVGATDNDRVIE